MDRKPVTDQRNRMTRADREVVQAAILQIARAERPITVRGLFYRVMSKGLVPKTENGYGIVQKEALKLRRNGELSYGWITDGSRRRIALRAYSGIDRALTETARLYRRRLWDDQNVYVEVWTEKDAITGVVQSTTLYYDVPLVVAKGFASETFLWEAAEQIMEVEKPTYIYQLGDHDPSGVTAFDKLADRLRDMVPEDISMKFERIAVTPNQIGEYQLPTRPTKDSNHGNAATFGDSVEVDAMDSNTLRRLVRQAIEQHIDQHALELTKTVERSERETLQNIANDHGRSNLDNDRERRRAKRTAEIQRQNRQREAQRKVDERRVAVAEIEAKLADAKLADL